MGWGVYRVFYTPEALNMQQITVTGDARNTEFSLPDGSVVWLGANSRLIYPQKFEEDHRSLSLEGQAYFEVAEDSLRPFKITAHQTITQVLGTAFFIKAVPMEVQVEVTVASGRVKFMDEKDDIKAEIVAIDSASMIVWLSPAMMLGTAIGNSTFRNNCPSVAPNASAASLTLSGTCRMPNAVSLMIGGIAKITVARTAGG